MAAYKKLLKRRKWLRPANGYGDDTSIRTYVEISKNGRYLEGGINIRDCAHDIGLDMWADQKKHAVAHLKMLDKLIKELNLVRDAYAKGMAYGESKNWGETNEPEK